MQKGAEKKILYLVVPCFNEEAVLPQTGQELRDVMVSMIRSGLIAPESRVVFVDDGSRDGTWRWIREKAQQDPLFGAVSLSRNTGHQTALYAGLMAVKDSCHMTVSLDADLQDDPAVIPSMVQQFYDGSDVVYAVRRSRRGDGMLKKFTAFLFYRLFRFLGSEAQTECGDFRLLSRRALEYLSLYKEERPFLRGLIPLLGLPSSCVYFDRNARQAGKSKYSLSRMTGFAMDGICSVSMKPLALMMGLGAAVFACAALWLLLHLFCPATMETVIASVWAACGLLLTGMGLLGQYIGRIWLAQLGRPRYLIRETYHIENTKFAETGKM